MGDITYATTELFYYNMDTLLWQGYFPDLPYKNNSPFRSGIFARKSYVNTTPTNETVAQPLRWLDQPAS